MTSDPSIIELTPEEQNEGHKTRVWAYRALKAMYLCSIPLTVFGLVAWIQTLIMIRTFINSGSVEFLAPHHLTPYQRLLALDISSASALIVFLFAFCLLVGSRRIVSQHRKRGPKKFAYAYPLGLFPRMLAAVCIRLGLIGTLISFVFIAMMLVQSPGTNQAAGGASGMAARTEATGTPVPKGTPSQQPEGSNLVEASPRQWQKPSHSTSVDKTGQSSFQVFLMLCASLYSTLVGCVAGYFAIPALDAVAARATGQRQTRPADAQEMQEQYESKARTILNGLDKIDETVKRLGGCVATADNVLTRFQDISVALERGTEGARDLKMAGETLKEAVSGFGPGQRRITAALRRLSKARTKASEFRSDMNLWIDELKAARETCTTIAQTTQRTGTSAAERIEQATQEAVSSLQGSIGEIPSAVAERIEKATQKAASYIRDSAEELHATVLAVDKGGLQPMADAVKACASLDTEVKKAVESVSTQQKATQETLAALARSSQDVAAFATHVEEVVAEIRTLGKQREQESRVMGDQFQRLQIDLAAISNRMTSMEGQLAALRSRPQPTQSIEPRRGLWGRLTRSHSADS